MAAALAATAAYPLWENGSLAQSVHFLVLGAVGTIGVLVGVRRARPVRARLWHLLAAGLCLTYLGDVLWMLYSFVLHIDPFPSPADAAYLGAYVLFAAGVAVLLRGRTPGRDRAGLVDGLIVATGGGVLAWVFLVAPAVSSSDTLTARALAAAYPLGDLLLVTMLARLVTSPGARTTSFWLVVAGLSGMIVPDVAYLLAVNYGDGHTSAWTDTGWILVYLLLGAAALHPSMGATSEPAPDGTTRGMRARLALLAVATVMPSGLVLVQAALGAPTDAVACAVGSVVVLVLVLVRISSLMERLRTQAVQLAALARTDGLTGVANRRTWDHELSRECALAARTGSPLAVALLDLDLFKAYNDARGHQAGDRLLVQAAALWTSRLGEGHLLARYGGEEFGVLLPGCDEAGAARLLEDLRRATPDGQTASVGVAAWDGTGAPEDLVARADLALYEAKRGGRDRLVIAGGRRPHRTSGPDRGAPAGPTVPAARTGAHAEAHDVERSPALDPV